MTFARFGKLALVCFGLPLLFADHVAAQNLLGDCNTTASRFRTYTSATTATGTSTFGDVVGTASRFRQGGTAPGCVIVTFAAEAMVSTGAQMMVQAKLEGDVLCAPDDVSFVPNSMNPSGLAARSMTFVCTNVAPGIHTVTIQFRFTGAGSATLGARTTVVQYQK